MISHSAITTYLDCQKKYELAYVHKIKGTNPHFEFGSMAHEVLETGKIPDEALYAELKEFFKITNWYNYFTPILQELNEFLKDFEILHRELYIETEEIRGVIDLVVKHKKTGKIHLYDYKFTNHYKDHIDLKVDQQLYIYSYLWSKYTKSNNINIETGYISIPKYELKEPRVLKTGKLSKDKAQKTTYKLYMDAIEKNGLNVNDYLDILAEYKNVKLLNIVKDSVNGEMFLRIMENTDNIIKDIKKGYYLENTSSYVCRRCSYFEVCKGNV